MVLSGPSFLPKEREMPEKLKFIVLWTISLYRKAWSKNEHPRTISPTQSGAENQQELGSRSKHSSKTTTTTGHSWPCTGQEVQKKNLPRPPHSYEGNIPANMDAAGSPVVLLTQLPWPLYGSPQSEMDLLGLTNYSVGRQKLPKDGLPRPSYRDPKCLLPRPCKTKTSFSMEGRLKKFADKLMGIIQDPFMLDTIQGHLLQFNQKLPVVKPTHKCKIKVPKTQESMMASEIRSMLSESTIAVGQGNKGFFTHPFLIPKTNEESHFIMNLKPLNWFIMCTKFKKTTLKQI